MEKGYLRAYTHTVHYKVNGKLYQLCIYMHRKVYATSRSSLLGVYRRKLLCSSNNELIFNYRFRSNTNDIV